MTVTPKVSATDKAAVIGARDHLSESSVAQLRAIFERGLTQTDLDHARDHLASLSQTLLRDHSRDAADQLLDATRFHMTLTSVRNEQALHAAIASGDTSTVEAAFNRAITSPSFADCWSGLSPKEITTLVKLLDPAHRRSLADFATIAADTVPLTRETRAALYEALRDQRARERFAARYGAS